MTAPPTADPTAGAGAGTGVGGGAGAGAGGGVVPSARQRARGRLRPEDPVLGWGGAIALTVFSLLLRLWRLGTPAEFQFDETYYAKDAWSLAHFGYVRDYVSDADQAILDGQLGGVWRESASMVVHPEVGKWMIALGETVFGMDPFGWRVSAAVVGSLMVLVMCRLVRRLTGSTMLGLVAGLLLCLDGLHFVLSRLALLDIFLAFFLLLAVACLVIDRDRFRERLADAPGGRILYRPWLLLGGVCSGLAVGTKWSALYVLAAFGILVWLWSAGARRSFGERHAVLRSAVVDGIPAFVHLVVVAALVYTASWTGWLVNAEEYEQHLSSSQYTQFVQERPCDDEGEENNVDDSGARWPTATEPDASGAGELVQSLRSLAHYHRDVLVFHTHYLNCSEHTYASHPAGWLLLKRPVGIAADTDIQPGTDGCTAPEGSDCLRQVLAIGTPTIWWGGALALLAALVLWVGRRDWRYGVPVVGVASTWLPWFLYAERPIFSFYAIASVPFTVIALALCLGAILGPEGSGSRRRMVGVVVGGVFTMLTLLSFAWFWPVYTHELLTHAEWMRRIWFSSWI